MPKSLKIKIRECDVPLMTIDVDTANKAAECLNEQLKSYGYNFKVIPGDDLVDPIIVIDDANHIHVSGKFEWAIVTETDRDHRKVFIFSNLVSFQQLLTFLEQWKEMKNGEESQTTDRETV